MISRIGDKNGTAEIAVVFIHGLGGSKETWKDFTIALNKKWTKFTPVDLLYVVYTPEDKKSFVGKTIFKSPDIYRLSNFLKNYLDEAGKSYSYVLLVGHSMGGLIARRYVVDNMDNENFNVTDLLTYATPHKGSVIPFYILLVLLSLPFTYLFINCSWITFFKMLGLDFIFILVTYLFSNPQVRQLALKSRFITKLNEDWTKKKAFNKVLFYTITAGMDWIVKLDSSNHYDDDVTLHEDAGKSHSTILKPVDLTDYSLCKLYNTIEERIAVILADEISDEEDIETEDIDDSPIF
ncbi:esterase/lipase family protein [Zobellia russellii]|uniref:esterase/lipase family protein n=1 Tax=Zobellia russellii TaxID=248907 RepID=UPI0037DCC7D1